jgi:hypothetical protein
MQKPMSDSTLVLAVEKFAFRNMNCVSDPDAPRYINVSEASG